MSHRTMDDQGSELRGYQGDRSRVLIILSFQMLAAAAQTIYRFDLKPEEQPKTGDPDAPRDSPFCQRPFGRRSGSRFAGIVLFSALAVNQRTTFRRPQQHNGRLTFCPAGRLCGLARLLRCMAPSPSNSQSTRRLKCSAYPVQLAIQKAPKRLTQHLRPVVVYHPICGCPMLAPPKHSVRLTSNCACFL